eukprot:g38578.t1
MVCEQCSYQVMFTNQHLILWNARTRLVLVECSDSAGFRTQGMLLNRRSGLIELDRLCGLEVRVFFN